MEHDRKRKPKAPASRKGKSPQGRNVQRQTSEDVRTAAFRLFGRHGYDGVSIDAIAKAVGLSKGALYWHFDGKEALFLDCLERLEHLIEEHILLPVAEQADPLKRIEQFFDGVANLVGDPRVAEGLSGYWQEPGNAAEARMARERLHRLEQRLHDEITAAVSQAQHAEQLASRGQGHATADTLIALMEAMLLPLQRRSPEDAKAIIDNLRATFFQAYRPRSGDSAAGVA